MTKVTLKDISESCLGKMLDQKKNKGIPQFYLGNKNVRWGDFDLDNLQKMPFEEHETNRYSIEKGDLVICEGGEPGRCAIWESDDNIMFQKALHRVRFFSGVNNYYVYYWLLYAWKRGILDKYCTGSTIKHLPGDKLKSIIIDLPDENTQNRIADLLNCLDRKIKLNSAINQNLLQQAMALFNNTLQQSNSVSFIELGSLGDVKGGKRLPKGVNLITEPNSHPYIRVRDLNNVVFASLSSDYEYVDDETQKSISRYITSSGDVLISIVGTIGLTAIVDSSLNNANLTENCVKVTNLNGITPEYLLLYLRSSLGIEAILKGIVGAVQQKLPIKNIQSIPVPMLPSSELESLNVMLHTIFNQISVNVAESKYLSATRDLLLPKLMSGELDVSTVDI